MSTTDSLAYLGRTVRVRVDRPLGSRHPRHALVYEVNYGYLEGTVSGDGEELDAYVLGVDHPVSSFTGVCLAVIRRLDDHDDKIVVAPATFRANANDVLKATHFQEKFFQSTIHLASPSEPGRTDRPT